MVRIGDPERMKGSGKTLRNSPTKSYKQIGRVSDENTKSDAYVIRLSGLISYLI